MRLRYFRTYQNGGQSTHMDGIGDSYTLCGVDTAGDDLIHEKPPEELDHKPRITCRDCQQIIAMVREHIKKPEASHNE